MVNKNIILIFLFSSCFFSQAQNNFQYIYDTTYSDLNVYRNLGRFRDSLKRTYTCYQSNIGDRQVLVHRTDSIGNIDAKFRVSRTFSNAPLDYVIDLKEGANGLPFLHTGKEIITFIEDGNRLKLTSLPFSIPEITEIIVHPITKEYIALGKRNIYIYDKDLVQISSLNIDPNWQFGVSIGLQYLNGNIYFISKKGSSSGSGKAYIRKLNNTGSNPSIGWSVNTNISYNSKLQIHLIGEYNNQLYQIIKDRLISIDSSGTLVEREIFTRGMRGHTISDIRNNILSLLISNSIFPTNYLEHISFDLTSDSILSKKDVINPTTLGKPQWFRKVNDSISYASHFYNGYQNIGLINCRTGNFVWNDSLQNPTNDPDHLAMPFETLDSGNVSLILCDPQVKAEAYEITYSKNGQHITTKRQALNEPQRNICKPSIGTTKTNSFLYTSSAYSSTIHSINNGQIEFVDTIKSIDPIDFQVAGPNGYWARSSRKTSPYTEYNLEVGDTSGTILFKHICPQYFRVRNIYFESTKIYVLLYSYNNPNYMSIVQCLDYTGKEIYTYDSGSFEHGNAQLVPLGNDSAIFGHHKMNTNSYYLKLLDSTGIVKTQSIIPSLLQQSKYAFDLIKDLGILTFKHANGISSISFQKFNNTTPTIEDTFALYKIPDFFDIRFFSGYYYLATAGFHNASIRKYDANGQKLWEYSTSDTSALNNHSVFYANRRDNVNFILNDKGVFLYTFLLKNYGKLIQLNFNGDFISNTYIPNSNTSENMRQVTETPFGIIATGINGGSEIAEGKTVGSVLNSTINIYNFQPLNISIRENPLRKSIESLHIFPNPTKRHLYFNLDSKVKLSFEIHDLSGKRIQSGNTLNQSEHYSIDLELPSSGFYILTVHTESGDRRAKFNFIKD